MRVLWILIIIFTMGCFHQDGSNTENSLKFLGSIERDRVYVLITVDTEQDLTPYLSTYRGIEEGIPKILELFEDYGVRATFFVTGNVAEKYPETIRKIKARGHEIGNHGLNHENFLLLNYTQKREVLRASTALLENITGSSIVSFRPPAHYLDIELLQVLEEMGYLVEASSAGEEAEIAYPYYPCVEDWSKPGNMSILMVPVSKPFFYPSGTYPRSWIDVYKEVVEKQRDKRVKVVVIGLHSWEFVQLEQEVPDAAEEFVAVAGNYTRHNLEELLEFLKDKEVKYVTARELSRIAFNGGLEG